ncbi:MAG: tyrosine-protein phosphatase [Tannerella sp.]|jgi:protein-tyrosine phosphatase|nr:tyrosine-protein phosphatase [Tannerella sp.]
MYLLKKRQKLQALASVLMASTLLFVSCSGGTAPFRRAGMMEGAPNFRDLGAYPSENGRHTVRRKIFRSQMLAQLSDSDTAMIKEWGIRMVIDFRSDAEVSEAPSRLPGGVKVIRLPIDAGRNDTLQIMQQLMSGSLDSAQCVAFMQEINRRFVTEFIPQYRAFFSILLQSENYPAVFHCTAGKDRTGFAAAMLLSALDVDWDTVMTDYLLTNRYLKPPAPAPQLPEQAIPGLRQMWGVQPSYLNAAKEEIMKHYGSIDNYLSQALNIGKAEKDRLKQYLLE